MLPEIRVKHKSIKRIAESAGCSRVHAANSLKGIVDSYLSTKVRKIAIEDYDGVEVIKPINNESNL